MWQHVPWQLGQPYELGGWGRQCTSALQCRPKCGCERYTAAIAKLALSPRRTKRSSYSEGFFQHFASWFGGISGFCFGQC
jgi:hypothetical protein